MSSVYQCQKERWRTRVLTGTVKLLTYCIMSLLYIGLYTIDVFNHKINSFEHPIKGGGGLGGPSIFMGDHI